MEDKDLKLWKEYMKAKRSGNMFEAKKKARELYKEMKGLIHSKTNRYRSYGLPMVAVESKAREQFMKALDRYDPKYNTKLSTHVINYLQGVNNYVREYKDIARIPQHRTLAIDNYSKTKADLEIQLGREPNAQEMARELKWDINEAKRMEKEMRKELSSSGLMEAGLSLDFDEDARTKETIDLVYMGLTGEEKAVMEYLIGYNGKPKLQGKEIANALNLSPSKVSRIRTKIGNMIKKYK